MERVGGNGARGWYDYGKMTMVEVILYEDDGCGKVQGDLLGCDG